MYLTFVLTVSPRGRLISVLLFCLVHFPRKCGTFAFESVLCRRLLVWICYSVSFVEIQIHFANGLIWYNYLRFHMDILYTTKQILTFYMNTGEKSLQIDCLTDSEFLLLHKIYNKNIFLFIWCNTDEYQCEWKRLYYIDICINAVVYHYTYHRYIKVYISIYIYYTIYTNIHRP